MGGGDVTVMIRYIAQAGKARIAKAELEALMKVRPHIKAFMTRAREIIAAPPEVTFWRGVGGAAA